MTNQPSDEELEIPSFVNEDGVDLTEPLNDQELRKRIQDIYKRKGYSDTHIEYSPLYRVTTDIIELFTSYRLSHEAEMKEKLEKWSEDTHYCTYKEESDDSRFRPICKWCGETEFSSSHDVARLLETLKLTPNAEKDKT